MTDSEVNESGDAEPNVIPDRRAATSMAWWGLWACWSVYVITQVADLVRDNAPWPLWTLRVLPLLIFMPGVARDNLRAVIWLCFVILFYFVSSVELVFARSSDVIAIAGLVSVVGLFVSATLFIRYRGPEQRGIVSAAREES